MYGNFSNSFPQPKPQLAPIYYSINWKCIIGRCLAAAEKAAAEQTAAQPGQSLRDGIFHLFLHLGLLLKDRTQLGISGMTLSKVRTECQKNVTTDALCDTIFFFTKVWGWDPLFIKDGPVHNERRRNEKRPRGKPPAGQRQKARHSAQQTPRGRRPKSRKCSGKAALFQ
jgi:hypothetical protein